MYQNNPLSRLGPGQAARVTALEAQGSMRRRLQDLGLTPGALVECLYKSPLGDPRAYLFGALSSPCARKTRRACGPDAPLPPAERSAGAKA